MENEYYNYGPGIFADPTVDFAFKRIFGTEQFKAATIGLLNGLLKNVHIVDVSFLNNELVPETKDQKRCIIDVLCKDQSGNEFIVEMQNAKQEHFLQRMVFYASRLISNQSGLIGSNAYSLHATYVIAFLNFDIENIIKDITPKDSYSFHFVTKEEGSGYQLPASPEYHFYSLKRFNKSELEIANEEDNWLYLLARSNKLTNIPEWAGQKDDYKAFFDASTIARFTTEESSKYTMDMVNEIDRIASLEYAKKEGREEGIKKGEEIGIKKGEEIGIKKGEEIGRKAAVEEMAKKMKEEGYPVESISKCTGLSPARIAEL